MQTPLAGQARVSARRSWLTVRVQNMVAAGPAHQVAAHSAEMLTSKSGHKITGT